VAYPEGVGKSSILMLVIAFGIAPAVASAESETYAGVNPESSSENLPPKVDEIPEGAVMLTWPGFMMHEDGSCFFVQTSEEVRFGTTQTKGQFELVIHDIRVHLKTNYLPLETQYFDTPVTRATVQRSGKKDVRMVFEMREDVTPTITQKKGKDGFNYVFVKFAK
jgi:colicin import membrane protein